MANANAIDSFIIYSYMLPFDIWKVVNTVNTAPTLSTFNRANIKRPKPFVAFIVLNVFVFIYLLRNCNAHKDPAKVNKNSRKIFSLLSVLCAARERTTASRIRDAPWNESAAKKYPKQIGCMPERNGISFGLANGADLAWIEKVKIISENQYWFLAKPNADWRCWKPNEMGKPGGDIRHIAPDTLTDDQGPWWVRWLVYGSQMVVEEINSMTPGLSTWFMACSYRRSMGCERAMIFTLCKLRADFVNRSSPIKMKWIIPGTRQRRNKLSPRFVFPTTLVFMLYRVQHI